MHAIYGNLWACPGSNDDLSLFIVPQGFVSGLRVVCGDTRLMSQCEIPESSAYEKQSETFHVDKFGLTELNPVQFGRKDGISTIR